MGIALNQHPTKLKIATEKPTAVVEGVGGSFSFGKRDAAREVTANTELRVVRGSWGIAAEIAPVRQASPEGMEKWGDHNPDVKSLSSSSELVEGMAVAARMIPKVKIINA
jgi:hypothetical protein